MAHGTPDYGRTNGTRTTYQITDVGELAVRLGSPISHDRRGDVMWWDDFECSLNKWVSGAVGAGSAVAIATDKARNGQNSVLLTAGVGAGNSATIAHEQAIPVRSRLGFEFSLCPTGARDVVTVAVWQYDDPVLYIAQAKVDFLNGQLLVGNAAGGFDLVYTFPNGLVVSGNLFHTLKLVWDSSAHEHVRLIFDDLSFDVSGHLLYPFGVSIQFYISAQVAAVGNAVSATNVYIDDAILTQNEV